MSPYVHAAEKLCVSCKKPLQRLPISRVFPAYHARCVERALEVARSEARLD